MDCISTQDFRGTELREVRELTAGHTASQGWSWHAVWAPAFTPVQFHGFPNNLCRFLLLCGEIGHVRTSQDFFACLNYVFPFKKNKFCLKNQGLWVSPTSASWLRQHGLLSRKVFPVEETGTRGLSLVL